MDESTNAKNGKFSVNERPSRKRCSVLAGQERHKKTEKSPLAKDVQESSKTKHLRKTRVESKRLFPILMNQTDLKVTRSKEIRKKI